MELRGNSALSPPGMTDGFGGRCGEKRSLGPPIIFVPRIRISSTGHPPAPACAAFIKESRMKSADASKLHRKSGVRLGERGAPVNSLQCCCDTQSYGLS
jgi:hypothetical protein